MKLIAGRYRSEW